MSDSNGDPSDSNGDSFGGGDPYGGGFDNPPFQATGAPFGDSPLARHPPGDTPDTPDTPDNDGCGLDLCGLLDLGDLGSIIPGLIDIDLGGGDSHTGTLLDVVIGGEDTAGVTLLGLDLIGGSCLTGGLGLLDGLFCDSILT